MKAAERIFIFRKLRWQLTFWFVFLTMVVYIISAIFGCWIFRIAMTALVDSELTVLTNELIPAVSVIDGRPSLQEWSKTIHKGPYRYLPIIQLYDKEGELIEFHGPAGVPILFSRLENAKRDVKEETYHIRVHTVPLREHHKPIGYLQLELSLKNIDGAIVYFGTTMALIAPFLLFGFGLAGYLFSSKAAHPVEESFSVLQRFVADASHELSTPISIVLANAESMEADISNQESVKTKLETITRSTERMSTLVSDLMLLAKVESPHLLVRPEIVELDKIIYSVLSDFRELFKAKSIQLTEESVPPVQIYGNSESIKCLITNLLQNALKYTDTAGTVKACLSIVGRQAKLSISDTGVGIPDENLPHIFDRFYRVDSSRSRTAGGSGLGLSIVKAIVDAHRGRIEVLSSPGKGTIFSIYLPLK